MMGLTWPGTAYGLSFVKWSIRKSQDRSALPLAVQKLCIFLSRMTLPARLTERESLYDLMCLRATIGNAPFASEKQGDPVNPEQCEWGASYFDYPGFWFEEWPVSLQIKTLGLDPSKGRDAKTGDYSAFIRLGRDAHGYLYCEADLKHRPTPQIVADGVEHVRLFQPMGFAIETNQFQELLMAEFQRVGQQEHLVLPVYGIDNTTNKQVRIRRKPAASFTTGTDTL